jgi:hypothetical protein
MRISIAFVAAVALHLYSAPPAAAGVAADVIVVVDTSGTMTAETNAVRAALNNFAAGIQSTSIDLHLILIGNSSSNLLCIPAPLGSGACPADEKLPVFRHILQSVGSNDALSKILLTYPQWSGSLRPGASTALVVVSDDDSSMSSSEFHSQFLALNPGFAGYTFHAMAASGNVLCGVTGMVYAQLAAMTGGVFSNVCTEAIDIGLTRIAEEIIGSASPPVLHPGCDIQFNQTSYGNGNAVVMQVFGFSNPTAAQQRVEVKIWLEVPAAAPIGLLNIGADGSFVLPPGYNANFGPATLFTITPQFPRGSYAVQCRFVDPVTGRLQAEDLNPFVVQ